MSRLSLGVFLFVVAIPGCATAQDFPKFEIFGGYSYLHVDTQGANGASLTQLCNAITVGNCPFTFQVHPGMNGWNAAAQFNLNSWLGAKADFSGTYGTLVSARLIEASSQGTSVLNFSTPRQSNYDFLFGPVISYRKHRYTPFAHALFGDEHVSFASLQIPGFGALPAASRNSFALALGGGVDIKVARHFSLRAGEFDYQFVDGKGSVPGHQNDYRFSAGVVLALGSR